MALVVAQTCPIALSDDRTAALLGTCSAAVNQAVTMAGGGGGGGAPAPCIANDGNVTILRRECSDPACPVACQNGETAVLALHRLASTSCWCLTQAPPLAAVQTVAGSCLQAFGETDIQTAVENCQGAATAIATAAAGTASSDACVPGVRSDLANACPADGSRALPCPAACQTAVTTAGFACPTARKRRQNDALLQVAVVAVLLLLMFAMLLCCYMLCVHASGFVLKQNTPG